jgi:hypothetical protein
MRSAVDQLEALANPDPHAEDNDSSTHLLTSNMTVRFGSLDLQLDANMHMGRFEFEPPTSCEKWPGPMYESYSLHKRMPKVKSSFKTYKGREGLTNTTFTTDKKHGRHEDHFSRLPLAPWKSPTQVCKAYKKWNKVKTTSTEATTPMNLAKVMARSPPLSLLTLPPEIRNQIWSHLAISPTSVVAQTRHIQPCPKLQRGTKVTVRRFPLEPAVARVNHQVQQEVLSIFYGCNTFTFERAQFIQRKKTIENPSTSIDYTGTSSQLLMAWKPSGIFADRLDKLTVKFKLETSGLVNDVAEAGSITFTLSRLRLRPGVEGLNLDIKTDKFRSKAGGKKATGEEMNVCICREKDAAGRVLRAFSECVKKTGKGLDLVSAAIVMIDIPSREQASPEEEEAADEEDICEGCEREMGKYSALGI